MEGPKQTSQDMWNGDHVLEPSFITIRRPWEAAFALTCIFLFLSWIRKVGWCLGFCPHISNIG